MPALNDINVVVARELLPSITRDNPRCQGFRDWKFHAFQQDPLGARLLAQVSAQRLSDNLVIWCSVVVYRDAIEDQGELQLMRMLDMEIEHAVDYIVSYQRLHVPGQLCENAFCEECYK